ncbi:MAG: DUF4159 domain-containing protein [Tepidisphaeraceae bacterium]
MVTALVLAAVCITALAIVLSRSASAPKVATTTSPVTSPEVTRSTSVPVAPVAVVPSRVAPAPGAPALAPSKFDGYTPGSAPIAPAPAARAPTTVASVASAPRASQPASAPASRPAFAIVRGEVPTGPISDADVGLSIQLGVDFLLQQFKDGEFAVDENNQRISQQGLDALCVYALASAERAIRDPRLNPKGPQMAAMLEKLKEFPLNGGSRGHLPVTYARSLRAAALATFNRPQDREQLRDDVEWLMNAQTMGAYTYDDRYAPVRRVRPVRKPVTPPASRPATRVSGTTLPGGSRLIPPPAPAPEVKPAPAPPPRRAPGIFEDNNNPPPRRLSLAPGVKAPWDNSNSQYGLLGVWAGADVGIEVQDNYWRLVQRHWNSCQLKDGQWGYARSSDSGYFSMNVAGIASLLVTHDYLDAPLLGGKRSFTRDPYPPGLTAGLKWLETDDNAVRIESAPLFYVGYNLFGIERVGLASGFKRFGRHDWFVELGSDLLRTQNPDGSFSSATDARAQLIETAYALLFLSRGRHPVMMNKLRFDEYWTNRPREISNLANFVGKDLERPINWQVVDAKRDADDWADAPVMFIASHKAPKLDDEQIGKLRTFAKNGGLIVTHADLASAEFNGWAGEFAKKIFPEYPLEDLPTDHALYTLNYTVKLPRPRLQGLSNGSRLLLVHSPTDISIAWQTRAVVSRKEMFEVGINLYLYATGKQRFRNRLDTTLIPEPGNTPAHVVNMARLKHTGGWNPEPVAWPRLARKLQWETGVRVNITSVTPNELDPQKFRLAHLTGTAAYEPTAAELAGMKTFVEGGGTLFVEACGGSGAFADAENSWLPQFLAGAKLQTLPPGDPLLKKSVDGTATVPAQAVRLYALEQLRSDGGRIKSARVGRGRVIFSALDLSSGLLGTCTWGVLGYLPEYSEAVVRNLVLTTAAQHSRN